VTRRFVVLVASTITLLALALGWYGFPGLAGEQARPAESVAAPRPAPQQGREARATTPSPTRDLFAYGDASARASTAPAPASPTPAAGEASTPPAPRIRLVGFLHAEGRLAAALVIDSTVDVVQAGESVGGYRVLALDEDRSTVRLVTPEGEEIEVGNPAP
jgi:hypothetical protein